MTPQQSQAQDNQSESNTGNPESYPTTDVSRRRLSECMHDDNGGLLLTLDTTNDKSIFRMTFCPSSNFLEIHPNIYAPESLSKLKLLGGGGSGVTVFSGHHPELGDVVMKHGGYKDTKELFALASIAEELKKRGTSHPLAALEMKQRIPEFRFLFVSSQHLRRTDGELWRDLKGIMSKVHTVDSYSTLDAAEKMNKSYGSERRLDRVEKMNSRGSIRISRRLSSSITRDVVEEATTNTATADPFIVNYEHDNLHISIDEDSLPLKFSLQPNQLNQQSDNSDESPYEYTSPPNAGYSHLSSLIHELVPIQKKNLWKFTQAQKAIGSSSSCTASSLLCASQLQGPLLSNLISQFTSVIRSLQQLTHPSETDIILQLERELSKLEDAASHATDHHPPLDLVSPTMDNFVGNAIKKNWHPTDGRFQRLRDVGRRFRHPPSNFVLTNEERLPVRHLARLLKRDSIMGETYWGAPMEHAILDEGHHFMELLNQALYGVYSPNALERIWNGGLADAGLHNLFLSETNLHMFDLGEPRLESVPGFLTKFLFSFFHALGMEEDPSQKTTTWVNRFYEKDGKLALTDNTVQLLEHANQAFEETLDALIKDIFDNDAGVRRLLIMYMTLQLLSDASFCLERWEIKGGGRGRSKNHQKGIEKWLWRALWDIYAAFHINTPSSHNRFKVGDSCSTETKSSLEEEEDNDGARRTFWKSIFVRNSVYN